jgi:hypothetical protein
VGFRRGAFPLALALAAAIAGVRAPEARADAWKDEKLGYSFAYPPRWTVIPVDPGGWLAAKFNSNREYEWNDPKNNFWTRHRPYIEVVVIPYGVKETSGTTVEKTDKGVKVTKSAPWKDLKEYMDKTFQERRIGGFYFSGEEEGTVNGLKVRRLEITVNKDVQGDRRIYGWEFAAEDCFYGLVAEILVHDEKQLKPDLFQSFGSFRVFPRTGSLPNSARTGEDVTIKDDGKKPEDREVTPEEQKKKRDDATARALDRIKQGLQKGWFVSEGKNFVAVSHADPKYTREVLGHCEALRAWLEQTFGYLGSGYAGKVIVRICSDRNEYEAFQQARSYSTDAPEATTFKDRDGWSDWNMDSLNRSVYYIWMRDKNERLLWALPEWIQFGVPYYVSQARSKNGRIEFKADIWDSVEMKNLRRSDDIASPRTYFSTTSETLWARKGAGTQTQFFIQFLLSGAASRNPKYRNLFSDYLKNLIFLLDSEKAPDSAPGAAPKNEKEEEEMIRARQESWRKREGEILQKLVDKTFAGWTDKDWEAFDSLYRQDLK